MGNVVGDGGGGKTVQRLCQAVVEMVSRDGVMLAKASRDALRDAWDGLAETDRLELAARGLARLANDGLARRRRGRGGGGPAATAPAARRRPRRRAIAAAGTCCTRRSLLGGRAGPSKRSGPGSLTCINRRIASG
jgi:hypothetical protein